MSESIGDRSSATGESSCGPTSIRWTSRSHRRRWPTPLEGNAYVGLLTNGVFAGYWCALAKPDFAGLFCFVKEQDGDPATVAALHHRVLHRLKPARNTLNASKNELTKARRAAFAKERPGRNRKREGFELT